MGEILEGVREASAQLFREVELRNWAMEVLDEYDPEFKFKSYDIVTEIVHPLGTRKLVESDIKEGWTIEEVTHIKETCPLLLTKTLDYQAMSIYNTSSISNKKYKGDLVIVLEGDIRSFHKNPDDLSNEDLLKFLTKEKQGGGFTKRLMMNFAIWLIRRESKRRDI
ncbi:hypothetical protein [Bacillus cereus]|uniref:Uncharacterized protein n=1 Tax=Bacillus cereus TaxID=1396 RepID=A0A164NYR8_BACCE|nr:hypothetical protein [Bacillus cereus]KZD66004.1 hypothetical protein B4088_2761 [Bacillus cereus]